MFDNITNTTKRETRRVCKCNFPGCGKIADYSVPSPGRGGRMVAMCEDHVNYVTNFIPANMDKGTARKMYDISVTVTVRTSKHTEFSEAWLIGKGFTPRKVANNTTVTWTQKTPNFKSFSHMAKGLLAMENKGELEVLTCNLYAINNDNGEDYGTIPVKPYDGFGKVLIDEVKNELGIK